MDTRPISKLYINVGTDKSSIRIVLKDNYGRTVEDYAEPRGKTSRNAADYKSVVKALELSAKHCRNKVYVFTDNRLLVNQFYGSYKIRNRELFRRLMEIKLLCGFFKCVRVFHVRREVTAK